MRQQERALATSQRFINLFKNKAIMSTFNAWASLIKAKKQQAVTIERFRRALNGSVISKVFTAWANDCNEEKRHKVRNRNSHSR